MASSTRFEDVIEKLYQSMGQRIDRISVNLRNEKPVGKERITEREQLANYMQIRMDPQAWQGIVQQYGIKSAIKYRNKMEQVLERTMKRVQKDLDSASQIPGVNLFGSEEDDGQEEAYMGEVPDNSGVRPY